MSGDGPSGADDEPRLTDGGRAPEELTDLDGIGAARADKLRDAGFETVADVRGASEAELADVLGPDLAGRVQGQLGAGSAGEPLDDGGTEDGPTVPGSGDDGPTEGGPTVPSDTGDDASDSGPSVPSGTDDQGTADTGPEDGGDDIGWEPEGTSDQPTAGGGEAEATVESGAEPTTGTTATTGATGTTATTGADQSGGTATRQSGADEESLLAAIVSFILPGVGNMITGDTDRGVIIFVVWVVWLIVAWGVGFFLVGTLFSVITLGLGFIVQLGIGLLLSVVELAIHVIAAIDAYRGSKVVDNVTGKVDQVRGN